MARYTTTTLAQNMEQLYVTTRAMDRYISYPKYNVTFKFM